MRTCPAAGRGKTTTITTTRIGDRGLGFLLRFSALIDAEAKLFKEQAMDTVAKSMGRVMIDASAIPFVDSSGIEALVDLTDQLSQSGRALKLCAANDTLKEVLNLVDPGRFSAESNAKWAAGGTTIALRRVALDDTSFIYVTYDGRLAKDASKL